MLAVSLRRPRREKIFGDRPGPALDRNARARIMHHARQLTRPTEKGRHYGMITGKDLNVLAALLWTFHNAADGRTFPSYSALAKAAGCARSHIAGAIRRLEAARLLTWVNRLIRIKERCADLFGERAGWRWRVIRTSNSYRFHDPQLQAMPSTSSKAKFQPGTMNPNKHQTPSDIPDGLAAVLTRIGEAILARESACPPRR